MFPVNPGKHGIYYPTENVSKKIPDHELERRSKLQTWNSDY